MYLLRCIHLIVKNLILSNQEKTLLHKYIYILCVKDFMSNQEKTLLYKYIYLWVKDFMLKMCFIDKFTYLWLTCGLYLKTSIVTVILSIFQYKRNNLVEQSNHVNVFISIIVATIYVK